MEQQEQQLMKLEGTVEHVIYENADSGYAVFEVDAGGTDVVVADVAGDDHIGAARVHLEHRVAGVGVLVDDVLDGAFQLHKLLFLLFHSRPLPAKSPHFHN